MPDAVVDTGVGSRMELVAVSMLLETHDFSVDELMTEVMSKTVEGFACSEFASCERLESTVAEVWVGCCSVAELKGVVLSVLRRLVLEASTLLLLGVTGLESSPDSDGVGKGEDDEIDLGNDTVVGVATLVDIWDVSEDLKMLDDVASLEVGTMISVKLVWFPTGCWRRCSEGKVSRSIW